MIILIIIRSFWIPIYIIQSLVGAYYIGITETNFVVFDVLKFESMSSFVPVFAFLIIVSLGVDYSIFLVMRYKEGDTLILKNLLLLHQGK
ncbi:MMPL family transporter [Clostridium sp. 19966]|uniref:MMPL family transporter n=1 Tax=Clostridium sp. 19966 TaxID=2768166 RepID=UPI0028DF4B3F|nr:MMPL family transporter [Clostridium sp. 19966]